MSQDAAYNQELKHGTVVVNFSYVILGHAAMSGDVQIWSYGSEAIIKPMKWATEETDRRTDKKIKPSNFSD